jgi:hypothetical protein
VKETISAADAWRTAQAQELRLCQERGQEPRLDERGKIVPSEEALRFVAENFIVTEEQP